MRKDLSRWIGEGDTLVQLALVLLVVAVPLLPVLVPPCIALVAVAVIRLRWKHRAAPWIRPGWDSALPWMAVYYMLHVVGMAWTTNTAFGAFDLEVKASFLLFPLLFLTWPAGTSVDIRPVLKAFVLANVLAAVSCVVMAVIAWSTETPDAATGPIGTGHFFESRFSRFLHPSYMALYAVMALAVWVFGGLWRNAGPSQNAGVLVTLPLAVFLTNSKMGWITLAVLLLHLLLAFRGEPRMRRVLMGAALTCAVAFAALLAFSRPVRTKLTQAFEATQGFDPASDRSSDLRRMTWEVGWDLLRQHPLTGVGTGDIKDELHAECARRGYVHVVDKRLNAHSQPVQSGIALGWPGLLLSLLMLLVPLVSAVRRHDQVLTAFLYLVLLNASVESLLEVQAGVVFLAAFAFVLHLQRTHDPLQPATH